MATTTVVNKEPATNELLCFVSAKVSIMTFDSLKKLCTDFYDVPEIRKARTFCCQRSPYLMVINAKLEATYKTP